MNEREAFVDEFIRNLEEWDILPGGTYKPAFRGKLIGLVEWFDTRNAQVRLETIRECLELFHSASSPNRVIDLLMSLEKEST